MENEEIRLPDFFVPQAWVLEYSPRQKAFHVESLEESIKTNINNMFADNLTDYGVIGMFKTEEEAHEAGFYFTLKKFNGKPLWER